MRVEELFTPEEYCKLAFDPQNGFGSKVLQTQWNDIQTAVANNARSLDVLKKKLAKTTDAKTLKYYFEDPDCRINREEAWQAAELMVQLLYAHYAKNHNELRTLMPSLTAGNSLPSILPPFEDSDSSFCQDLTEHLSKQLEAIRENVALGKPTFGGA